MVAVCVPVVRPAGSTPTVSVPGVVPVPGLIETHGWSAVAVQFRNPPAASVIVTAWVDGVAPPWTIVKLSAAGAGCNDGFATVSVTGRVRGEFETPAALSVSVAG